MNPATFWLADRYMCEATMQAKVIFDADFIQHVRRIVKKNLRGFLVQDADLEDVVSETMLRIVAIDLRGYDKERSAFKTFIDKRCYWTCLDYKYRRGVFGNGVVYFDSERAQEASEHEDAKDDQHSPEKVAIALQMSSIISEAFYSLSEADRSMIERRHLHNDSHVQTGVSLGISTQSALRAARRSERHLRRLVEAQGVFAAA